MIELKVMLKFILILITFFLMNSFTYAESKKVNKNFLDDIVKEIEIEIKKEKDAFYQCWIDNIKPNSTDSHTNVVALYCSNKTGYKLP